MRHDAMQRPGSTERRALHPLDADWSKMKEESNTIIYDIASILLRYDVKSPARCAGYLIIV